MHPRTEELSAHGFELASAAADGAEGGAAPASCRASSSSYIITRQPHSIRTMRNQRTVTRRFLRLSGTSMSAGAALHAKREFVP